MISLGVMPCPSRMAKLYAKLDITRRTVRVAKKQQVLLLYGCQVSMSSEQEQTKEGAQPTSLLVCGPQDKTLQMAPRKTSTTTTNQPTSAEQLAADSDAAEDFDAFCDEDSLTFTDNHDGQAVFDDDADWAIMSVVND